MRRMLAIGFAGVLLAAGCTAGGDDGGQERRVRVDFRNDEFASFYWRYFPRSIDAHPGDTVVFQTEWTGEPHTVTFGSLVDRALLRIDELERKYADLTEDPPPEVTAVAEREYGAATADLPNFDPYLGQAAQNASQPCYLRTGAPPTDPDRSCPREAQDQPAFDGRHSYYSSGFITPQGASGTEFRVELDEQTPPGEYRFYCVIHFPYMQGRLTVRPEQEPIESQREVNRRARVEIEELARPLREAMNDAEAGRARSAGMDLPLPLAGYHSGDEFTVAINEFVPRAISTRVGEPVTWTIVGAHTISFDVPQYAPIYLVDDDGTVRRNPIVDRAAGGSPDPPPVDFTKGPVRVDGGTWDGEGFISSGLIGSEPHSSYTLRFSRPGRYRYACLVHPPMVGTVNVRA